MTRRGITGSLSGLYDLVQFPWERLILLACLVLGTSWLYGKVARCQAEVSTLLKEARSIVNSSPCNEQRELFKHAFRCEDYERRLEPEYQEEVWWTCFLNTFIFYRSWLGLIIFGIAIYAVVSVCRVPAYKPLKPKPRPRPEIHYYPDPALLEYPSDRRTPRRFRSREASSESSSD